MDIVTLSYKIYIMHYVCTCLFCVSMVRERKGRRAVQNDRHSGRSVPGEAEVLSLPGKSQEEGGRDNKDE